MRRQLVRLTGTTYRSVKPAPVSPLRSPSGTALANRWAASAYIQKAASHGGPTPPLEISALQLGARYGVCRTWIPASAKVRRKVALHFVSRSHIRKREPRRQPSSASITVRGLQRGARAVPHSRARWRRSLGQLRGEAVAVVVEQKQRGVAHLPDGPGVGTPFLLPMPIAAKVAVTSSSRKGDGRVAAAHQ